ncbi:MAG: sensor domain-containing diguanylate cyclase [Mariprofundaceae bacterium]
MIAIEQILEVSIRLSAERDLDRLLELIIEQTNALLRADRSSLFLVNQEEGYLESKIAQGMREETIRVPMDCGVVGWVVGHKKLLNVEDVQQDKRHYKAAKGSYPPRSMLSVPLLDAEENVHGVIQAMRLEVDPFSEEEEMLIRAMASQATVSICNALLNQQMKKANAELERKVNERTESLRQKNIELEEISVTDALTGAYNRRYFDQILVQEQSLSDRYGAEFSLIMFDIDFFKKVNDSIGHDAGDMILNQLTALAQSLLRDCDFLFRYGGEEFIVLLPRTGALGAQQLAERVRKTIAQHSFSYVDQLLTDITISLGVATWDEKDQRKVEKLLKRADQALYCSKNNGRNQVSLG